MLRKEGLIDEKGMESLSQCIIRNAFPLGKGRDDAERVETVLYDSCVGICYFDIAILKKFLD